MWIVPESDRVPSVVTASRHGAAITGVVVHASGSPHGTPAQGYSRNVRWATGKPRSSTHLNILRNGRVLQLVPLDLAAEHTLDSAASWGDRVPVDRYTIGIDLMNVGALTHHGGEVYRNGYRALHHGGVAHDAQGRPWESFPMRQVDALLALVPCIIAAVPALADPGAWIGHESIQPGKVDPGPVFPWRALRAAVAAA